MSAPHPIETTTDDAPSQRSAVLWVLLLLASIAILAIAATGTGYLYYVRNILAFEQGVYDDLSAIWSEHQALRARGASETEWEEFERRAMSQWRSAAPKLASVAGAKRRAAQQLLWAGRDYLPRMLDNARENRSLDETKFALHLARAGELLGRR